MGGVSQLTSLRQLTGERTLVRNPRTCGNGADAPRWTTLLLTVFLLSPPPPSRPPTSSRRLTFPRLTLSALTCERTAGVEHASGSGTCRVQRFMKHLRTCSAYKQPGLTTNCRRRKSYYEETGESQLLDFVVFRASSCTPSFNPFIAIFLSDKISWQLRR